MTGEDRLQLSSRQRPFAVLQFPGGVNRGQAIRLDGCGKKFPMPHSRRASHPGLRWHIIEKRLKIEWGRRIAWQKLDADSRRPVILSAGGVS